MPVGKPLRKKIIDLLLQWKSGTIDEYDVIEEGEDLFEQYVADDSDADCDELEEMVVILLDGVLAAMLTVDDVPVLIKLLQTPPGEEKQALAEWDAYRESVDYDERVRKIEARISVLNDKYTKRGWAAPSQSQ